MIVIDFYVIYKQQQCTNTLTSINCLQVNEQSKWKKLLDTYRKKEKSGAAGTTIEEKSAQWKFYDRVSFMKPYMAL